MQNKIIGDRVMIVGDLHFSDVFTGKHKNYLENCIWVVEQIITKVKEKKPSALVLLGDIIGWTETNIKDRQIFITFINALRKIKEICPIYCVCGNHDIKGYPDFMFLAELGIIITSQMCGGYFDFYGTPEQEIPEVRFHMVDYKQEDRHLDLHPSTTNVVLAHNNFTINGVTTWYSEHDGIELGMMQNFSGVDMVISGHIHNPSPEIYSTQMPNGKNCMLFYTGCPTRPIKDKNMYDSCWYMFIEYDHEANNTTVATEEFKLKPASEIFYSDDNYLAPQTEEELAEIMRKEALKDVLGDLLKYRIQDGDYMNQIDVIQNATQEAKDMAKQYLQTAFNLS